MYFFSMISNINTDAEIARRFSQHSEDPGTEAEKWITDFCDRNELEGAEREATLQDFWADPKGFAAEAEAGF